MKNFRIHPRVNVMLPCKVQHPCGYLLSVTAVDLSITGLMVETTEADFKTIIAHQQQITLNQPVEAYIKLELGDEYQGHVIDSLCRAIYVRRSSQDQYRIGFKFLNLSPPDEAKINSYIFAHLEH